MHLAAIEGPDPGHTIELGASGRSIPAGPWVVVGRGILADCQISDPSMSRRHFRARSGRTWWGRNGVWVEHQGRLRHLSLGRRWRSGSTLFEVRTDGPTPRIAARDFTRIVPVFV
ncbi:MAG TPA: hypothetical protein VK054_11870, partial [Beutenbergiaceae bacterium]|nr:hypothetical protein [Beutenbergiaceae bacterium]